MVYLGEKPNLYKNDNINETSQTLHQYRNLGNFSNLISEHAFEEVIANHSHQSLNPLGIRPKYYNL